MNVNRNLPNVGMNTGGLQPPDTSVQHQPIDKQLGGLSSPGKMELKESTHAPNEAVSKFLGDCLGSLAKATGSEKLGMMAFKDKEAVNVNIGNIAAQLRQL